MATLVEKAKGRFKDMTANVMIIYGEKGIAPFKRPLVIAVPTLFILYMMVYSPITDRLSKTSKSVVGMRLVAQYAEEYEGAKNRIAGLQRRLPLAKDKSEWLTYVINNSARNVGVSVDSVGAQKETEVSGYLVVARDVQTVTTYHQFGKWIAEIENSPIFLRITEVSLQRDENIRGSVKVSFTLSTVFPRFGGGS